MFRIGRVVLAGLVVAAGSAVYAQVEAPGVTGCTYRFSSDGISWCVSRNGNLMSLASSSAGQEHIRVGNLLEGYVVCVPTVAQYYDLGAVAAGWAPAELIAPAGATSVSIRRTTLDGRFTLVQEVTGGNRGVTIGMSLKNNFGPLDSVRILRSADLDIDSTFGGDVFDRSADSVWARQIRGVTMVALNPAVSHETRVSVNTAPRSCTPASVSSVPATGDLAGSVRYNLGAMPAGATKTVRVRYNVQ